MSEQKVGEILQRFEEALGSLTGDEEVTYVFSVVTGGSIGEDICFRGRNEALNVIRGVMERFASYAESNGAMVDVAKIGLVMEGFDLLMGAEEPEEQGAPEGETLQ